MRLLDGDLARDDPGDASVDRDRHLLGDATRHLARGGLGDHPARRDGDALHALFGDVLAGGHRDGFNPLFGNVLAGADLVRLDTLLGDVLSTW